MRSPRSGRKAGDAAAIARGYDRVALVLQGGGALGAYQIGDVLTRHKA
jgi:predicted acylesterase/phospholipase RssA